MRKGWLIPAAVVLAALLAAGCRRAPSAPPAPTAPPAPPAASPAPPPSAPPAPPAPPRIVGVTTEPPLPDEGGWLVLPRGEGTVVFRVQAENATRVRVYLVPTGTEMRSAAALLGEDADGADGWTVTWRYPDAPLLAHLLVQAEGPGGVVEDEPLNLYHEEPSR